MPLVKPHFSVEISPVRGVTC